MQPISNQQDYKKYQALLLAARVLRQKQTPYEKKLWGKIRHGKLLDVRFHRQQILLNSYIADFYAPAIKLAIELDGSQHNLIENKANDMIRDDKLNSIGIFVKRYSNIIVSDSIDLVVQDLYQYIWQKLKQR